MTQALFSVCCSAWSSEDRSHRPGSRRALSSCGHTIERRMPRGAYSSDAVSNSVSVVHVLSLGWVIGVIYRDRLLPGKPATLEIVEDCSVYRTWKFLM